MISKKEFKANCSFHEYGTGRNKINAIYYDYKSNAEEGFSGYKYMVSACVDDCLKAELIKEMYKWVILEKQNVPYWIDYKYAPTDKERFKISLSMKTRN